MNISLTTENEEIKRKLKEILLRSLRIRDSERRALCTDIGIEPSSLPFLNVNSDESFAKELIDYLFKQNKKNSLCTFQ
ncbi:hypothetical protein LC574_10410 [Nostoc sp. CHAB 5715]|nr:hypothetical protein [Nostoc sp. CHAB 5715]